MPASIMSPDTHDTLSQFSPFTFKKNEFSPLSFKELVMWRMIASPVLMLCIAIARRSCQDVIVWSRLGPLERQVCTRIQLPKDMLQQHLASLPLTMPEVTPECVGRRHCWTLSSDMLSHSSDLMMQPLPVFFKWHWDIQHMAFSFVIEAGHLPIAICVCSDAHVQDVEQTQTLGLH